ncbi:hypothetical protein [Mycolicibacterium brumae]|uniref:hypothetical protein n=1 Tax=Mycolicibacterium brumae TaxID=85968 RepID=UPI000AE039FA|nr:hypothetical protein [Mycolicibacterium brumae]MCV7191823.1 hypothetical protein [Mycolicibacterium brumae]UWW07129.1 hypothetical protein L2Z93_000119 [Mycolicibacterium brumae]
MSPRPRSPPPRLRLELSDPRPAAATGISAHVEFGRAPCGRPYSVREITVGFPPGFVVDADAVPRCAATNPQLCLRGPRPWAASLIGTATATVDFGWPRSEGFGGPYHQFLLGDGELIGYEINQLGAPGPAGFTVFPLIFRAPLDSSGFTVHVPEAPSFRRPDGMQALTSIDLFFTASGVFRTPQNPPDSGGWRFTLTFDYYIGARRAVVVDVPIAGAEQ